MMTTQQEFRLRDVFNPAAVEQLAHNIAQAWPAFDRVGFATTINSQLEMLSFSGRNALIRFLGKGVAQRAAFGVGARSEACRCARVGKWRRRTDSVPPWRPAV